MILRFIFLSVCFTLPFLAFSQVETNFFQENKIYYNPASMPADSKAEAVSGVKISSFVLPGYQTAVYSAAAVRLKRFSVIASNTYRLQQTLDDIDISLSTGYILHQKDAFTLSAGLGFRWHTIEYYPIYYIWGPPNPNDDPGYYYGWGKKSSPGLTGGVFLESRNLQAGISGYLQSMASEINFHAHYIIKMHENWNILPGCRLSAFRSELLRPLQTTHDWSMDMQTVLEYKKIAAAGTGFRVSPFYRSVNFLASAKFTKLFTAGFSTDFLLDSRYPKSRYEFFFKFRLAKS